MDRNEAIKRIRAGLKERSGKTWSVTGNRGSAWGWISIHSPPSRRTKPYGYLTPEDKEELADLLGLEYVHDQGIDVPASWDHRLEYVDRAEGNPPMKLGERYWD